MAVVVAWYCAGRSALYTDKVKALWGSFAVLAHPSHPYSRSRPAANDTAVPDAAPLRFFFMGDSGYRSVPRGAADTPTLRSSQPHCPAFRDVGDALGPFDLAALGIGAYSPRWFMYVASRVWTTTSFSNHWCASPPYLLVIIVPSSSSSSSST